MAKPAILTVDDDPAVSQAITRDLRRQYGADYQIVRATSGAEALAVLAEFALRDRPVGADRVRSAHAGDDRRRVPRAGAPAARPDAKLVLLTAYADTDVAIKAINDIGLDYYLLKPWDPPEERLYPVLDDLLSDWRDAHPDDARRRPRRRAPLVGAEPRDQDVPRPQPRALPLARPRARRRGTPARRTLAQAGAADLPLVLVPDGEPLRAPSTLELADALGLRTSAEQPLYDLCIVGGGPAGLAAAVYGASEGLQTVVVEREAPGRAGRARAPRSRTTSGSRRGCRAPTSPTAPSPRRGASAPRWCSPATSSASRSAARCGPCASATEPRSRRGPCSSRRACRTGCSRRPGSTSSPAAASTTARRASEARACEGEDVYIVGAANSAGQAALNIARFARRVVLLVRADALEKSMSQYLVERIRATDNIEVRLQTEVVAGRGDGHLEAITLADRAAGTKEEVPTNWLFVFIGASPRTDWLGDDVARDERGFVHHGHRPAGRARRPRAGRSARPPFALETSVPGVFAAGDVRLDSMKRVASAVGEGAMSVYLVHRYLATI